ncbi:hypothetical protein [Streptomyces kanamyceticus]|uniref:hypothetical protein n=1 Tax=Streptomyces kanamyceticus TaxID=1967 RepID=UPI0037DD73B5
MTYYEAAEDGLGPSPNGRCWTTELEADPRMSNRTVGQQAWLYINRERPDIPEVDVNSAHIQLQGYAAGPPDKTGTLPRLHGIRCTACGSPEVQFTDEPRAHCHTCGKPQTQREAALCSSRCEECSPRKRDTLRIRTKDR